MKLNLATTRSISGLMICGINWGRSPEEPQDNEEKSFFSDERFNNFAYRNRLLRWFELFGHPLERRPEEAGAFEKSIVQTNWMPDQSVNMHGRMGDANFIREWDNFAYHVESLRPRLIIFTSVRMLEVLNSPACQEKSAKLLGPPLSAPQIHTKCVSSNQRQLRKFRVGFQKFSDVQVIALPHPTGSRGLSDDYVAAFATEISPLIAEYRQRL